MPPSSFKPLGVEKTLEGLSLVEKSLLLAGAGRGPPIPSRDSLIDGPNGVRGTKSFEGVPAACFPGATGLAASWDTTLLKLVGKAIALDCKDKGVHVLLGPTVNIQRSPLGGRGFESYSEDPHLSGHMARSFIQGLQSEGVAATIKHYVTNDSEFERMSISSEVSTRALREIYLRPFELACRETDSPSWAMISAYNQINGLHASENKYLLDTILRKQWGWDGMIMSDWFSYGPPIWRGSALQRCVVSQKLQFPGGLRLFSNEVLKLFNKVSTSGIPEDAEETGKPTEEMVKLLWEAAASANVLLKNDSGILPLDPLKVKSIAVIGPNADAPVYSGGGSASLRPYKHTTVLQGIRSALGYSGQDVEVQFAPGALAHKEAPLLGVKQLKTKDGKPGMDIEWFHEDPLKNLNATRVHYTHGTTSNCAFIDNLPEDFSNWCWATITSIYTPEYSGVHEFGVAADGLVDLYVDGKKIVDNSTSPTPGRAASTERLGTIGLQAKKPVTVVVQHAIHFQATEGYVVSGGPAFTIEGGIQGAVEAAKSSDAAIVVIGLNNDWESESYDRTDMSLPGATNQLVSAILEANKQTVVVVISGTPVTMPWAATTSTIIQYFYGGGESVNGLADVLFGKVNPSSKLPLSFPKREEDTPSYLNFPGQNGKVHYVEPSFSYYLTIYSRYTQFGYLDISISGEIGYDSQVEVSVTVKNLGQVPGQEVVQIYIRDIISRLDRPAKELKGFGKSRVLAPGETDELKVSLDRYAFAYYDDLAGPDGSDGDGRWVAEAGEFEVIAARSSVGDGLRATIMLAETFEWL
ncbi:unnamed protein product [Rhizoctonia solani]|uniref:beta-glucosidase n=1 Tax=Rhizoctonia solani TaxID=456999 RepID=A0A8H3CV88_9AGAM|nr:unnamed protein product [Rhizoctonia solani]